MATRSPALVPGEPFLHHTDISLWDSEWIDGAFLTHRLDTLQRLRLLPVPTSFCCPAPGHLLDSVEMPPLEEPLHLPGRLFSDASLRLSTSVMSPWCLWGLCPHQHARFLTKGLSLIHPHVQCLMSVVQSRCSINKC